MNGDDLALLALLFMVLLVFLIGMGVGGMAASSSIGQSDEARERKKVQEECDALPSPSMDRSKRFPTDQKLRAAGFAIYSRPNTGQPTWTRNGVEYLESVALELLTRA